MSINSFHDEGLFHDEIRSKIMDRISSKKQLHKRGIKQVIDDVKNKYLWNPEIEIEDLNRIIGHFKNNWQDLKGQAKSMRRMGY